MSEKLSERLIAGCVYRYSQWTGTCQIDADATDALMEEAARIVKAWEDAPVGEIVSGRANSFGGYTVEIKHDISWVRGERIRLLVEDAR